MQFCASCESIFTPSRSDARYCSSACRQHGYRRRKADSLGSPREATEGPRTAAGVFRPPSTGSTPDAAPGPAERARDIAQREAERAREATRRAIDLAHTLIG